MFPMALLSHQKNTNLFRTVLSFIISISLCFSSVSVAQEIQEEPYWLFPGETLPGEKSVFPLSVGSESDDEIRLSQREWFLLKPAELVYGQQVDKSSQVELGYTGPRLNAYNAQMYYRLVTGMILKETMLLMGLNSFEAKRYYDSAAEKGLNFETASLSEIGNLPSVLQNLYINFKRPSARQALLPYLITPLAIANHQSDFRHFLETENISDFNQTCRLMTDIAPMSLVQSDLLLKKTEIDEIDRSYQDALALLKTSKLESVRLTELLSNKTAEESIKTSCLNELKNQVNKGAAAPKEACVQLAGQIVEASAGLNTWTKFQNQNLQNKEGDYVSLQKAKSELEETESLILSKNGIQESQIQLKENIQSELSKDESSLKVLKQELSKQNLAMVALDEDYKSLKAELLTLQEISSDLDQGKFQSENDETAVLNAISETGEREQQINAIKVKLPLVLENKTSVQRLQTVIDTQINFLAQKIESAKVQLNSMNADLSEELEQTLSELENEKEVKLLSYRAALDSYNFSDYILSLISKDVFNVESEKTALFQNLEKEKAAAFVYEQNAEELKALRSGQLPALQAEYNLLTDKIDAYSSNSQMGWYLDQTCDSKKAQSVFLSRAPLDLSLEDLVSDDDLNGRWGLFNLDYKNYSNSLNSGLALNLQKYINLSVRKIISHYDYMNLEYYSSNSSCSEISKEPSQALKDQIVGSYSMWTGGESSDQYNSGFCKLSGAQADSFGNSLNEMINYSGSLLDQTLPEIGVHSPKITLEREAYYWLTKEVQVLAGLASDSDLENRREGLIKSLVKVLANDYNKETEEESSDKGEKRQVQIATSAPGAELYNKVELTIGSEQNINTIGEVELYSAPIDEDVYKAGVTLSLNDKVEVLEISNDFPGQSVKANWVRVMIRSPRLSSLSNGSFWMPAWPLTYDKFVSANGEPVYPSMSEVDCPVKRLIKELTNFKDSDKYVTRLLPEIKTSEYDNGLWQMSWRDNEKTSPAYTDRGTYIACELFGVEGQTAAPSLPNGLSSADFDYTKIQGIRIITVDSIQDVNGKTFYIPTENYGGFVHSWIPGRNIERPRIILGEELDADWSKKN